jgi:hypothetical protein
LWLVVGGTSIPVLVIGYAFMTPHGERAVDTASVSVPAAEADTGGWGEGGYTMMPAPAPGAANAANATGAISENWAGYTSAANPGTFTSVSASWAQPAVTCTAPDTFSSFWVGLDGDGTNSVEQTGTEADCNGGAAAYQGWFEMFPQAPVFYDNPVQPGDAMSASVVANGGGAFTLTLTDSTQGWTQATVTGSTADQHLHPAAWPGPGEAAGVVLRAPVCGEQRPGPGRGVDLHHPSGFLGAAEAGLQDVKGVLACVVPHVDRRVEHRASLRGPVRAIVNSHGASGRSGSNDPQARQAFRNVT